MSLKTDVIKDNQKVSRGFTSDSRMPGRFFQDVDPHCFDSGICKLRNMP